MTCFRQPGSIESLIFAQIVQQKPRHLEDITGVGLDVMIKASNPNHPHNLSAVHVPNLDAALLADGRNPVFLAALHKMFERACEDFGINRAPDIKGDIGEQIIDHMKHAGQLAGQWQAATSPTGDGGANVTAREATDILATVSELRATIDCIERIAEGALKPVPLKDKAAG